MRLRIRHPDGMVTLSAIEPEQTIATLKQDIHKAIGLLANQDIQLSGGYPPKPIENDQLQLSATGIRDGDTLNVRVLETTHVPEHTLFPSMETHDACAIETTHGYLTLRVMEDDNSCLFRSMGKLMAMHDFYNHKLGYVLERDASMSAQLRKVVAEKITSDPWTYSDIMLGQPREKYIEWIQRPSAWGGAIELALFSDYFKIEIDSIDVQTGRIDKFGEGLFDERVLIVYSGIHYDALALAPMPNSPSSFDQTRFPITDHFVLDAAKKLVDELRKKHKYTDVANFTLKCEQCNKGLKGEKDAQNHATTTGHTHFTEYQS